MDEGVEHEREGEGGPGVARAAEVRQQQHGGVVVHVQGGDLNEKKGNISFAKNDLHEYYYSPGANFKNLTILHSCNFFLVTSTFLHFYISTLQCKKNELQCKFCDIRPRSSSSIAIDTGQIGSFSNLR